MSLPSGYKKLEYIQSSGTQYIDTGFKPNQNTRVVMEIDPSDTGVDDWFFDGRNGVKNKSFGVYCQYALAAKPWYSDYGTSRLKVTGPSSTGRVTIDKNKNVCAIGGYSVTHPEQTFQSDYNMYLLCLNSAGSKKGYVAGKLYSCRIYNDGVLIRNFVPCKNASNVVGLWDDANNTFYSNAGSGTFTAGPEVIGSNRVLVNAKGYDANSGTVLVNGMVYHLKKGRGLLNGMGYDIQFNSGTPISDLAVGSTVKIVVNGTLRDFLIVHQGLPSSMYDESCNGTWLLMKDIYENRVWQSGNIDKYESSDIHAYLNSTFLNLFDSNIKDAIKQVKIPYRNNGGLGGTDQSGANGLSAKIFLLSGYEIGLTTSDNRYLPQDGAKLSYFEYGTGASANNKRIAKLNGSAAYWWLRSPLTGFNGYVFDVTPTGSYGSSSASDRFGIRPALVLPSNTLVPDEGTITT